MNEIINSNSKTITSLEISVMTGKAHKNVLADCRKMLAELELGTAEFLAVRKADNGKEEKYIVLPKRECLILASGYSIKLRAKIIDRWAELESCVQKFNIPTTLSGALQLAANQAALIEIQTGELVAAKPKVDFVDNYVDNTGLFSLTEVAKTLKFKRNDLIHCLVRDKRLFRRGTDRRLEPYASAVNAGMFMVKTGSYGLGHAYSQAYITPKGIEWISKTYATELGE